MNHPTQQSVPQLPADYQEILKRIDDELRAFIESKGYPQNLSDAIAYATLGGGKRIRPALAWYTSIACGGTGIDAVQSAIAVELIHAFSLVHDDLPAMDDDDLRRGRPTLHIHTNQAMAILAGDAMLSLAYESLIDNSDPTRATKLIRELANGTRAMIVGQVYDTLGGFAEGISQEECLELIHTNKTGALLCTACRMGAISSNASPEQLEIVTQYAHAIGLQFQIVDDLLDIEGTTHAVGKTLGKDEAAGKLTYPSVIGVEQARAASDQLGIDAQNLLDQLAKNHSRGPELIKSLRLIGTMLTSRNS
ncbi:MAG: polyprenyl synthetase family protein [Phycisphaerales bacterium]|nr:polyprenyl synthetase family protein [Phycisphaerales bacterium]